MPDLIEVRGVCGHKLIELDPRTGLLRRYCRHCSRRAGEPVFHWFRVERLSDCFAVEEMSPPKTVSHVG